MKKGFTLIELLAVIAIIALLTAILLPTIASVQENNRETETLSHMHTIDTGIALCKLDTGNYPTVLLGYAAPLPGGTGFYPITNSAAIATYTTTQGATSLYPTFVNDWHAFTSDDNPIDSQSQVVTLASLEPGASMPCTNITPLPAPPAMSGFSEVTKTETPECAPLVVQPRNFYTIDGLDCSPQIGAVGTHNQYANGNSSANFQYVLRYQQAWTGTQATFQYVSAVYTPDAGNPEPQQAVTNQQPTAFGPPANPGDPESAYYKAYLNQMHWQKPADTSYVTSTTYHYGNSDRVIALFLSGSAIKLHTSDELEGNQYDDSASCWNTVGGTNYKNCATDANGDNPAKFWKIANGQ